MPEESLAVADADVIMGYVQNDIARDLFLRLHAVINGSDRRRNRADIMVALAQLVHSNCKPERVERDAEAAIELIRRCVRVELQREARPV